MTHLVHVRKNIRIVRFCTDSSDSLWAIVRLECHTGLAYRPTSEQAAQSSYKNVMNNRPIIYIIYMYIIYNNLYNLHISHASQVERSWNRFDVGVINNRPINGIEPITIRNPVAIKITSINFKGPCRKDIDGFHSNWRVRPNLDSDNIVQCLSVLLLQNFPANEMSFTVFSVTSSQVLGCFIVL